MRHFTNVKDIGDLQEAVADALEIKRDRFADHALGKNRTLLMIFFNSSLRTRLSTQKAAMNLGMNTMVLDVNQGAWKLETERGVVMDGDKSEHLLEAIPVMGCYADIIGVRSFARFESKEEDYTEKILTEFIRYSGRPVFSMEAATRHPLQSYADLITIEEHKRTPRPKVVMSWAPHPKALPQAVPNSFAEWMNAAGYDFVITHPEGYELDPRFVGPARVEYDQQKAFEGADFIYAKNWAAYADPNYGKVINKDRAWTVDTAKMALTNDAFFMHCLPVRRNMIVTDEVIESPRSLVIPEAANREISAQAVLKKMLLSLFISLSFLLLLAGCAEKPRAMFTNPVIHGDMADPSVIRVGSTYYATGTSSEWAPYYPLYSSADLVNWKPEGYIFDKQPDWTASSFWAPELYYHNGTVFCYYTARRKTDSVSYIGVATAPGPTGPYTDHGVLVEYGTEAIDAFIFDDGGQLYISWKAYGLDKRPIEIIASRLSADGLHLEGEPFTLLRDDERIGMEGQYHFKRGDYYYIVYSPGGCCGPGSDYNVCVARAKAYAGPYEKYPHNPILHGGDENFLSVGHGTGVELDDGRIYYLSHAYRTGDEFYLGRQPVLHEMTIDADGWVCFPSGKYASLSEPVPFAGTIQQPPMGFEDRFTDSQLRLEWSWNYPYANIRKEIRNHCLYLSGTPKDGFTGGTALCVRPRSANYTFETNVGGSTTSGNGLTLYGDDKNHLDFLFEGGKLVVRMTAGGQAHIHEEIAPGDVDTVFLRIIVENGCYCSFAWSADGETFQPAKTARIDCSPLIRWDRVARPGLIHTGDPDSPGVFAYFRLND